MVLPEKVRSTRDEALSVRSYVRTHPRTRRITVVTTGFHTARARWIFRRMLCGMGVEVRMSASNDPRFVEEDWYRSRSGIKFYAIEMVKTLYYRLRY